MTVAALAAGTLAVAPAASAVSEPTSRSVKAASVVLKSLPVKAEKRSGYDRDLFRHWIDADGDGCDTREEVLIAESKRRTQIASGCRITKGRWVSAFDGVVIILLMQLRKFH